ncbi:MAG: hypothetical protein MJE66_24015 [Proteobacteria bacterium]|nr:hypothetical protein [Pseudomonadota bacterium]
MQAPWRTLTRCLVCGFGEVRTDQVIDRGVVLLAECPRCENRFTARPAASARPLRLRAVDPRADEAA